MPSRVVRGDINFSRSLSRVSLLADLTFRALIVAVDDYGRLDARPLMLKATLFPARDDVTHDMVAGWIDELAREGCVRLYSVGNYPYLSLPNWEKHRGKARRAAESRFPPEPPGECSGDPRISGECSGDPRVGSGEWVVGSVYQSSASADSSGAKPPKTKRGSKSTQKTKAPEELTTADRDHVRDWIEDVIPKQIEQIDTWIEECLSWHRAKGTEWLRWDEVVVNWIRKGENRDRAKTGDPPLRDRRTARRIRKEIEKHKAEEESYDREPERREDLAGHRTRGDRGDHQPEGDRPGPEESSTQRNGPYRGPGFVMV